jgi:hypothetical protein
MPRSAPNAESADDYMSQLRRQVEQKKLDAIRERLQDKHETLMHMQNNKLPSGHAGDAPDEMSRFANEQLHRVHAAQERLLSAVSSEPVSANRSANEISVTVSAAGPNRGFSKLNTRPDLFLASAAPVAFAPPNFLPQREREIRPVFATETSAASQTNSKHELFKPTSPSLQRASQPARSNASARDEVWERKRQQALAANSAQPSLAPDLTRHRSKLPDTNEFVRAVDGVSGKDEGRSIRDEIWEQKKKSRGIVDGVAARSSDGGSAQARVSRVVQPSDRRRVSFAAQNEDVNSEVSYDLIQRVFQKTDDVERRDAPKMIDGFAAQRRSVLEPTMLGVPSTSLQQERNRQLTHVMELQQFRQKQMQQDVAGVTDQRQSTSALRSFGEVHSEVSLDVESQRETDARSRQQEYAMELQQQIQQKQQARRMPDIDSVAAQSRAQGAGGGFMIGEGASQRESDARSRQQEYAMELQQQMQQKQQARRMPDIDSVAAQSRAQGAGGFMIGEGASQRESDARSRQQEYAMELQQQMQQKQQARRMPDIDSVAAQSRAQGAGGGFMIGEGASQRESDARSRQQEYAMELQQQMQQKQQARRMPDIDSVAAQSRAQGAGGGFMIGEGASQRESDARSRQQEYAMELQQQMREKELAKKIHAGGGMQQDAHSRIAPASIPQRSFDNDARSRQQEYAMELQQQMREKELAKKIHAGGGMQQDAHSRIAPASIPQRSFDNDARSRQQEYAMELQQQMREKELAKKIHAGGGMQQDAHSRIAPASIPQRSFDNDARSRQQEYAMELQQQLRQRDITNRTQIGLGMILFFGLLTI